ncbi:ABC-type transport system related with lipoprotein release, permease component [Anaerolinea thermolimosa]|uniref:ABC transporter permease n=1 Tax=Anaerolinea thermolimosa TaxID=229919 RepID=UPI0007837CD4|nr:ABC transporter permease [Anaerolinea thermolimosa]GAP05955.1 ABC-type transport system related with lipoprotein release, permease component [Anaerolinea thermolimosa]
MMRPRWRKVLADLTGNPVRTLLVVLSIAVGLMAVGMIIILHHGIGEDMHQGYAAVNPANIQIRVPAVERDYIDHLKKLNGVRDVEGVRVFELRIRALGNQYKPIKIKAYTSGDRSVINQVRLLEGRWPPKKNEIVLEANRLGDTRYRLGEEVEIKLPNGDLRYLKLVGIVNDQTIGADAGGAGFFLAPIQGYILEDTLSFLNQPEEANLLLVTVDGDANDLTYIREVADRILDDLDRNGIETFGTVTRRSIDHPNAVYVDAMTAILYLLGFLVIFLSGFLIINTLSALLNQQLVQIGVMKTFGATRLQLIAIYLTLVVIFSLLGLIVSIPLANLVAYFEFNALAPKLNYISRGLRFVPQSVLIQAVIAMIVPQMAALIPVVRGTRLPIQQALSGISGSQEQQLSRFSVWLTRIRGLSRPAAISLRNTFRQRVRLALTLVTLALGGAIFIGTFNMRASLENYIARLARYHIADVNLSFTEPYRIDELSRVILGVPGVKAVEGWATALAQTVQPDGRSGETVLVQGPPDDTVLVEPIMIKGRWLLPGDYRAVVLSEVFLEHYPGLKPGDRLRLKIAGKEQDWTIVGFYRFAGKNIGLTAFTRYESLAEATHTYNRSADFRVVAEQNAMSLQDQEALAERLEQTLADKGYKVQEARAGKSLKQRTTSGLDTLTNFLLFLAMLMAIVGSIGLTGTMSLNVLERTREIGVMRTIGASNRDIMRIVITEGVLIGLISWVISVVAALPVSQALSRAIGEAIFGGAFPLEYVLTGPLIWFGVILVFSTVASILPARNAARLTIREILAYE